MKKAGLMLRERIVLLTGDGVAHAENRTTVHVVAPDGDQLAGARMKAHAVSGQFDGPRPGRPAPWTGNG